MTPWSDPTAAEAWPRMAAVAAMYSALFGVTEAVRRSLRLRGEATRKLAHIAGGLMALLLPSLFESSWPVVVLAVGFTLLLTATARFGSLQSIHAIRRRSVGAYWYPGAIAATFVLAQGSASTYAVGVLALTLGDGLAGVVGQRYGRHHFSVWGNPKTVEGSATAFSLTAAAVVVVLAPAHGSPVSVLGTAVVVGLVVAVVEALSPWGLDNITVPLAAVASLGAAGSVPMTLAILVGLTGLAAAGMVGRRMDRPTAARDWPGHR